LQVAKLSFMLPSELQRHHQLSSWRRHPYLSCSFSSQLVSSNLNYTCYMPSELQRHQQPKLKAASIPQLHKIRCITSVSSVASTINLQA